MLEYVPNAPSVDVRLHQRGDETRIEVAVEDVGPGIPSAELKEMFKPPSVATPGAELESSAMGAGVLNAGEIVAAHGGTISVRSALGRGTTFWVRFPRVGEADGGHGS